MKKSLIVSALVWILYVVLHFCYKWIPVPFFKLLGCPEESLFQHMKMAFFAYSIVSAGEFFWFRKKITSFVTFLMSRMLSVILFSFLVYVIWYPLPLFFGVIETVWGEVLYSNIILLICLLLTKAIEAPVEKIRFKLPAILSISFIYGVILLQFSALTFMEPPLDLFEVHSHSSSANSVEGHDHGHGHDHNHDHGH